MTTFTRMGWSTAEEWYGSAERFADEGGHASFDPEHPTEPLEHFEPLVRRVFARARTV